MNRRQRKKQKTRQINRFYELIDAAHHRPQNWQHRHYLARKWERRRRIWVIPFAGIGIAAWLIHLSLKADKEDETPPT